MTIVEMLGQSGVLTLLGMAVVFGFLVTMVLVISVVGKIINAGIDPEAIAVPAGTTRQAVSITGNDTQVTAAITAAVNEYRRG